MTTAVGPVEYLIVEFPVGHRTGENLPLLVDLVDKCTAAMAGSWPEA
jgi:hypothetical protein